MDAFGSFVDDKGNKQWVWLARDVATRQIVWCYDERGMPGGNAQLRGIAKPFQAKAHMRSQSMCGSFVSLVWSWTVRQANIPLKAG